MVVCDGADMTNTTSIKQKSTQRHLRPVAFVALIIGGAVALAGAAKAPVSPAKSEYDQARLVANLSEKLLYTYLGDSVVDMYDIADGRDRYPTPRGRFSIRKLIWNPSWVPPDSKWARKKKYAGPGDPKNPMKVVKIFFREPDFYIHGTGDINSLGSAESHGCIRMHPDDVMKLGRWVMDHGGSPREENWFMRLIHSRRETKVIYLSEPVPLRVLD
jgi:lipoprotein-anchoring transpeptidase ErfK/SrfK